MSGGLQAIRRLPAVAEIFRGAPPLREAEPHEMVGVLHQKVCFVRALIRPLTPENGGVGFWFHRAVSHAALIYKTESNVWGFLHGVQDPNDSALFQWQNLYIKEESAKEQLAASNLYLEADVPVNRRLTVKQLKDRIRPWQGTGYSIVATRAGANNTPPAMNCQCFVDEVYEALTGEARVVNRLINARIHGADEVVGHSLLAGIQTPPNSELKPLLDAPE